jgi:folate-dependent phosphoribosylglycinamide formyltransferase PurN
MNHFNTVPDYVYCNTGARNAVADILPITTSLSHVDIENTLCDIIDDDTIVTLHGYMRIISPRVCNISRNIFNGHPALLTRYPELKGKDMQEAAFNMKDAYPFAGSVVHQVISELDAGCIESSDEVVNDFVSVDDAYAKLKETSFNAWVKFLTNTPPYNKRFVL